jgi:hypothetical protein
VTGPPARCARSCTVRRSGGDSAIAGLDSAQTSIPESMKQALATMTPPRAPRRRACSCRRRVGAVRLEAKEANALMGVDRTLLTKSASRASCSGSSSSSGLTTDRSLHAAEAPRERENNASSSGRILVAGRGWAFPCRLRARRSGVRQLAHNQAV